MVQMDRIHQRLIIQHLCEVLHILELLLNSLCTVKFVFITIQFKYNILVYLQLLISQHHLYLTLPILYVSHLLLVLFEANFFASVLLVFRLILINVSHRYILTDPKKCSCIIFELKLPEIKSIQTKIYSR